MRSEFASAFRFFSVVERQSEVDRNVAGITSSGAAGCSAVTTGISGAALAGSGVGAGGSGVGAGGSGVGAAAVLFFGWMTGILPVGRPTSEGRTIGGGVLSPAPDAGFEEAAPDLLRCDFTFATSSSVRLASAEPLPVTPALLQTSTKSLLSMSSSLARA